MPPVQRNFFSEGKLIAANPVCLTFRQRFAAAEILTTQTAILNPVANRKYRLVDAILIALGGTTAGITDLRIQGTQSSATVNLFIATLAGLGRSVVARPGSANTTALADGAIFAPCDTNTGIYLVRTGGALTGATHVDVLLNYYLESATLVGPM